jgi:tetratricopeptide (TPR) repeat protein
MKHLTQEILNNLFSLARNSPKQGLDYLRQLQVEFPNDQNLLFNSGAILIDVGSDLGDINLILEGIKNYEQIIEKGIVCDPILFYNIANGFVSIYELNKRQMGGNFVFNPETTPLVKAKSYYRQAIQKSELFPKDLHAQIWVNYGNCLSYFGRSVEALASYDKALKILPTHIMAKGNLAIELDNFSRITKHNIFKLDALDILSDVCSHEALGKYASVGTLSKFSSVQNKILEEVQKMGLQRIEVKGRDHFGCKSKLKKEYEQFCSRNQLFLNLCHSCRKCKYCYEDNVTFSIRTSIDDDTTFIMLSRVLNSIKEQYANARFVFYQSLYPAIESAQFDKLTSYVDNLDYAIYGIRSASLKAVFQNLFNIFDKIAHFINDYFNLNLDERKVKFTTNGEIWKEKGGFRSAILQEEIYPLFALYDIAREIDVDYKDSAKDGYRGYLRRIRNVLTHEYLILHVDKNNWATEIDDETHHMLFSDFVDKVMELMVLVRSSIIYLIAFIDVSERKKKENSDEFVMPMVLPEYDASLYSANINYKKY